MLTAEVFSEDLGSCVPLWKNPSRTRGCKWGLLKRERKYKGSTVGTGGVHAFPFQVLLKPTLTHGEGRPRRFPPNNE
jgi:hypothetical protein